MQAIILAAGKGTRMGDLTNGTPKPMLKVLGKTLLEYKLDILPSEIDEVVIVVGHHGDKITEHLGGNYKGRKISYIKQESLDGTAHCLWQAKEILKERFLVLMGDDIYCKEDIENCLKEKRSLLVKEVKNLKSGGKIELNSDGSLKDIIEGSNHDAENALVNAGLYVLGKEIFDYELVKIPGREEYGLPQTLLPTLSKFPIKVVKSTGDWLQITGPDDLKKAEDALSRQGRV